MLKVFSVLDSKAGAFLKPFCSPNQGTAVRDFSQGVYSEGSPLNQFPEDFSLFELGEFDDTKGVFINREPAPHQVVTAVSVLAMRGTPRGVK